MGLLNCAASCFVAGRGWGFRGAAAAATAEAGLSPTNSWKTGTGAAGVLEETAAALGAVTAVAATAGGEAGAGAVAMAVIGVAATDLALEETEGK